MVPVHTFGEFDAELETADPGVYIRLEMGGIQEPRKTEALIDKYRSECGCLAGGITAVTLFLLGCVSIGWNLSGTGSGFSWDVAIIWLGTAIAASLTAKMLSIGYARIRLRRICDDLRQSRS